MMINQSVFIQDLILKEDLIDCNIPAILMKAGFLIEMLDFDNYKKTKPYKYL